MLLGRKYNCYCKYNKMLNYKRIMNNFTLSKIRIQIYLNLNCMKGKFIHVSNLVMQLKL